jgi:hypothetical protein
MQELLLTPNEARQLAHDLDKYGDQVDDARPERSRKEWTLHLCPRCGRRGVKHGPCPVHRDALTGPVRVRRVREPEGFYVD